MCHHTATLAQSDECKFITCCEHNMIHIVWNRSRISLTHNEVQRLHRCWNNAGVRSMEGASMTAAA
jgi:hypothetical protein